MFASAIASIIWLLSWLTACGAGLLRLAEGGLSERPPQRASDGAGRNRADRPPDDPLVAKEVLMLLDGQAADWNRGDLAAFCSAYADDAVFLSTSGVTTGREGVLARYKKRYPDRQSMGNLSFEIISTRLRPRFASVAARWKLAYSNQKEASGLTLLVLEREGQAWKIVQDASM
jgi:uncharacterized protein (TIGR02246 family)